MSNSNNKDKKKNKLSVTINLYFLIPYIALIILRAMDIVKYNWFLVITSFLWVPILIVLILGVLCLVITKIVDYVEKIFDKSYKNIK